MLRFKMATLKKSKKEKNTKKYEKYRGSNNLARNSSIGR
jgi:hypothetical protein